MKLRTVAIIIIVLSIINYIIPFAIILFPITISIVIFYLIGSLFALPFAMSEEKKYKDRKFFRPLITSLKYSWLFIYYSS